MRVSRTLPNVPLVVASSCASDRRAHASSKRRFAQRLYVKKSGSPVVIALISFHDLSSNNASRKRWGRKRGWREHIIACAEGREPALRDDKRRRPSASGVVDGEHQRCARRKSLPDTCLPCASPYRLPTILLLAFPSAVSLWQNQKHRRARITPRGIPGGERLSAHSR